MPLLTKAEPAQRVQALASYLQHESLPSIVLSLDYTILAVNTAYQQQFSAGEQYVGRKCYEVSHHYSVPCDQAGEHCPMRKAQETGESNRVVHVHHTPRGTEHVDVELRPIFDDTGEIEGYVERLHAVRTASPDASGDGLVGASPAFNHALEQLQRVAGADIPVLLQGESGTGKELFAQAVHAASKRAGGPFVVVDCSGLSEGLLESELFGYEKGAFTGATARKTGLVETAEGGTLFLDEIGDVPLSMQVKLLRLIESRTYRRVGAVEPRMANFRLVAATHKPLGEMVGAGLFRKDLYYRINAFPIRLPALREREGDVGMLAQSLLRRAEPGGSALCLDPEALSCLRAYDWPGNVRELRNVIERAVLFADDGVVRIRDLPDAVQSTRRQFDATRLASSPHETEGASGRRRRLSTEEIQRLSADFGGSRKDLAKILGLSERTLYRRLKGSGRA